MCGYTCICDQLLHVNACINRPVHVNMNMHVLLYCRYVYMCVPMYLLICDLSAYL